MGIGSPRGRSLGRGAILLGLASIALVTGVPGDSAREAAGPAERWNGEVLLALGWDSMLNEALRDGGARPELAGTNYLLREPKGAPEIFSRRDSLPGAAEAALGQYSLEAYDAAVVLALAHLRAGSDRADLLAAAIPSVTGDGAPDGPCGPGLPNGLDECIRRATSTRTVTYRGLSPAYRTDRFGALAHTALIGGGYATDGTPSPRVTVTVPALPQPVCTPPGIPGAGTDDDVLRIVTGVPAGALRTDPVVTSALLAAATDLRAAGYPRELDVSGVDLGNPGPAGLGGRLREMRADVFTVATVSWLGGDSYADLEGSGVLLSLPLIAFADEHLCGPSMSTAPWYIEVNLAVETARLARERGARSIALVLSDHHISRQWVRSIFETSHLTGTQVVLTLLVAEDRYTVEPDAFDRDLAQVLDADPDAVIVGGVLLPSLDTWVSALRGAGSDDGTR